MPMKALTASSVALLLLAAGPIQAQTILYWGGGSTDNPASSVDTSSTAVNGGSWNNSLLNWNTSTSATSGWQSWASGASAVIKSNKASGSASSTISLTDNITVGGISVEYSAASVGYANQGYTIDGSGGARTITLNQGAVVKNNSTTTSSSLTFGSNAILAGTNGLTAVGNIIVNSASTVSGAADISAGSGIKTFAIGSTGSLLNLTSIKVGEGVRFEVTNSSSGTGSNSLNDSAVLTLERSSFNFKAGAAETLGQIVLAGAGSVNVAQGLTLTVTNGFSRGENGKGVLTAAGGTGFGTTTRIVRDSSLGSTSLIPYAIYTSGTSDVRFLSVDSSGVFQTVVTTTADKDLSSSAWAGYDSTTNAQIIGATGSLATNSFTQDVTLGTLAVGISTASTTVDLNFGTHTLTTQAVALSNNLNYGVNLNLGASASDKITSSTGDLTLIHDRSANYALSGNFTVNATVTDSGSTPVSLTLGGSTGNFTLNAANTHTGKTYVNSGVTLGTNGSLLKTSELNIASGFTFSGANASAAANTWGGSTTVQKLSGGGTYAAGTKTVTIGANGTLDPGSMSTAGETLTFSLSGAGKLSFASGSKLALTLGTDGDSIAFLTSGDWLTGSGNFTLALTAGTGFQYDTAYAVFSNVTTAGFNPGTVSLNGTTLGNGSYTWSYANSTYYVTVVPEPSSIFLAVIGCLGVVVIGRNMKKKAARSA